MKSSYAPARALRPFALTIPIVTVVPRPNGLPIATTYSPTCTASLDPSETNDRSFPPWIRARRGRAARPRPHGRRQLATVRELHANGGRAGDDVCVGRDMAAAVDDESRAERASLDHLVLSAPASSSEEELERIDGRSALDLRLGGDVHDRRPHGGDERGHVRRAGEHRRRWERRAGRGQHHRRAGRLRHGGLLVSLADPRPRRAGHQQRATPPPRPFAPRGILGGVQVPSDAASAILTAPLAAAPCKAPAGASPPVERGMGARSRTRSVTASNRGPGPPRHAAGAAERSARDAGPGRRSPHRATGRAPRTWGIGPRRRVNDVERHTYETSVEAESRTGCNRARARAEPSPNSANPRSCARASRASSRCARASACRVVRDEPPPSTVGPRGAEGAADAK